MYLKINLNSEKPIRCYEGHAVLHSFSQDTSQSNNNCIWCENTVNAQKIRS